MGCGIVLVAAAAPLGEERRGGFKSGGAAHDDDGANMVEKKIEYSVLRKKVGIILWCLSMPHNSFWLELIQVPHLKILLNLCNI